VLREPTDVRSSRAGTASEIKDLKVVRKPPSSQKCRIGKTMGRFAQMSGFRKLPPSFSERTIRSPGLGLLLGHLLGLVLDHRGQHLDLAVAMLDHDDYARSRVRSKVMHSRCGFS
jgi:hypothetical protein